MKLDARALVLACAITFLVATYVVSPKPEPEPKPRPFLTAVVKLAKTFLWLAMFAEQPPEYPDVYDMPAPTDGAAVINHARSL